jgi:hypothetical protein
MTPHRSILAVLLLAVAGGAEADTRETQQQHLDQYTPYLEAPVEQFRFHDLDRWQLVGPEKVVVWTTVKDAYLITVDQPCARLEYARSIGLTSQQSRTVSARFDFVTFDQQRCQIVRIQPIDLARMEQARDAAAK